MAAAQSFDRAVSVQFPDNGRLRLQALILVAVAHLILIAIWAGKKQVAREEAEPFLIPVWTIVPPPEKVQVAKSPLDKVAPRLAPRRPTKQATLARDTEPHATAPIPPAAASQPAEQPAPTPPTINLDGIRDQALEMDRHREVSPIERLHEQEFKPHTIESTLGDAAKRGARKDCQTAYAGAGLLAVVPLLIDTITDHGCKWK